jgi:hypothetical protein
MNGLSAWIDGSNVYGNTAMMAAMLRDKSDPSISHALFITHHCTHAFAFQAAGD